jgi:putative transposase
MATVMQAYRFALDPTPRQQGRLASHTGATRFAFNWGLALVKTRLDQRQTDPAVQVPWTLFELQREWNQAKHQAAPWWAENSKEAYKSGRDGLARALANWSDSRSGRRKGRPMRFPRWKKARTHQTCRFSTGAIRVLSDHKHVQLPRIGVLKTHESTRKLTRRIDRGTARILSATISRRADRWYVSFTVEVERHIPSSGKAGTVGVDAGVRHLAVLSTGEVIANPRSLEASLMRLRRLNRELARRKLGSTRRNLSRRRLAHAHARVASARHDALHKLTTSLATQYGMVVVEHLNLSALLRNHRIARAIQDTGMGMLRRQLTYKTTWYGSRLVVAEPFYPSSKRCSACGWVKAKLTLAERTIHCAVCGLVLDRDLNAARNLAQLAQHVAQSGWETTNARGADVRPGPVGQAAMKREASSPTWHQAGTVLSQGKTADGASSRSCPGNGSPT